MSLSIKLRFNSAIDRSLDISQAFEKKKKNCRTLLRGLCLVSLYCFATVANFRYTMMTLVSNTVSRAKRLERILIDHLGGSAKSQ